MKRLGLFLALPILVGCGRNDVLITGRVMQKGRALPGGQLTFRPANPKYNAIVASIDEQGNYSALLPVGDVQVSVDNRSLEPRRSIAPRLPDDMKNSAKEALSKPAAAPPPAASNAPTQPVGRYVPINRKYYSVDTSGIKFTVESGKTEQNIELN